MKKSRKSKDRINNIIIVAVLLALLWFLYSFFKYDMDTIQKHLTRCREQCYPRQVIESLSNRHCVCQDIVPPPAEENEEGDKEWQTLDPDNSI